MKSALKHTVTKIAPNGDKLVIDIRIGDESLNRANGHADFSVTGSIHEKRGNGWECEPYMCGCVHEAILEHAPELAPFVALHLSDQYGAPMYAAGTGFYFLTKNDDRKGRTRREVCKEHLRATDAEMDVIEKAEDEGHFAVLIESLGLPSRWKVEADAAIAQIEAWTGEKFDFTPTRTNFKQVSAEQKAQTLALVNSGYYAPAKVQERKEQDEKERKAARIAAVKKDAAEKIQKVKEGLSVDLFMESIGYGEKFKWNWIYYNHTNAIAFNPWNHVQPASDEVIQRTKEAAQRNQKKLPKGIKVEVKA